MNKIARPAFRSTIDAMLSAFDMNGGIEAIVLKFDQMQEQIDDLEENLEALNEKVDALRKEVHRPKQD